MTLDCRLTAEPHDYSLLAAMLNEVWTQTTATQRIMQQRFSSGSLFIVAYDLATEEDKDYITQHYHLSDPAGRIPIGLLETISITTHGDLKNIPATYNQLTHCGTWRVPAPDSDTLLLVDVTVLPSRYGSGDAKEIITFAKQHIKHETIYDFVWTYTPDIAGVKKWHQRLGAKDTCFPISNARPGFKVPDVNVMDYS